MIEGAAVTVTVIMTEIMTDMARHPLVQGMEEAVVGGAASEGRMLLLAPTLGLSTGVQSRTLFPSLKRISMWSTLKQLP